MDLVQCQENSQHSEGGICAMIDFEEKVGAAWGRTPRARVCLVAVQQRAPGAQGALTQWLFLLLSTRAGRSPPRARSGWK